MTVRRELDWEWHLVRAARAVVREEKNFYFRHAILITGKSDLQWEKEQVFVFLVTIGVAIILLLEVQQSKN